MSYQSGAFLLFAAAVVLLYYVLGKRLLEYEPKYTCLETIDLAVKSYLERGLIRTGKTGE